MSNTWERIAQRLTRLEITTWIVEDLPVRPVSQADVLTQFVESAEARAGLGGTGGLETVGASRAPSGTLQERLERVASVLVRPSAGLESLDNTASVADTTLARNVGALAQVLSEAEPDDAESVMRMHKILTTGLLQGAAVRTTVFLDGDVHTEVTTRAVKSPGLLSLHEEMLKISAGFWGDVVRAVSAFAGSLVQIGRR